MTTLFVNQVSSIACSSLLAPEMCIEIQSARDVFTGVLVVFKLPLCLDTNLFMK